MSCLDLSARPTFSLFFSSRSRANCPSFLSLQIPEMPWCSDSLLRARSLGGPEPHGILRKHRVPQCQESGHPIGSAHPPGESARQLQWSRHAGAGQQHGPLEGNLQGGGQRRRLGSVAESGRDLGYQPLQHTVEVSHCPPRAAEPFLLWPLLTSLAPGKSQTDCSKVWISTGSLHLVGCHSELCPRSQAVPGGSGRGQRIGQYPQLPELWPQISLSRSSGPLNL